MGLHLTMACIRSSLSLFGGFCRPLTRKSLSPQYGFFDDKVGPVTLCVLIMVALTAILIMAILDYVHG